MGNFSRGRGAKGPGVGKSGVRSPESGVGDAESVLLGTKARFLSDSL